MLPCAVPSQPTIPKNLRPCIIPPFPPCLPAQPPPPASYLQHEDVGCMKDILYQCPGHAIEDSQPADGVCANYTTLVAGTAQL